MPKLRLGYAPSRFQRKVASPKPAKRTDNIRVKLTGKATLEQLSTACQVLIASLEEMGVQSVQNGSLYFAPLNKKAERMDLVDENGEILEVIEIDIPEVAQVKSNGGTKRLAFPGGSITPPGQDDPKTDPKKAA